MSEFFNSGLAALAQSHGVEISLVFMAFPDAFNWPAVLADEELARLLDNRRQV